MESTTYQIENEGKKESLRESFKIVEDFRAIRFHNEGQMVLGTLYLTDPILPVNYERREEIDTLELNGDVTIKKMEDGSFSVW